jgi:hypothetical protein
VSRFAELSRQRNAILVPLIISDTAFADHRGAIPASLDYAGAVEFSVAEKSSCGEATRYRQMPRAPWRRV